MADNIKVVIKVRPLIKREIDDNLQKQWAVHENTIYPFEQSGRDGIGSFTFDHVFDDTSLTQDVYEKVARPIVEAAVEGMNGTIFAYGQTSSGKTYTMMGDAASPGVIPLAISNIFQTIESKVDRDFLLRVSYIEIYNERIRDLLDVSNVDLKIHEDFNGQVIVKCKEEVTSKPNQVLELMRKGDRNRSTGETQMNERSSRSHTIFIIIIESRRHVSPGEEEENCVNVSQLNLVDLAGSERAGQTGATRLRLREGGHINKSLSTLGNVIRQLSDAQGDTTRFISFRDSKLTRILQTSLGGNAKTGIICAVTPAVLDETYSTLTFAMCAKAIENKPKVNAVMSDATQIKRLTKEMRCLQEELESKKHLEVDNKRLQEQLAILRDKILMGNSEEGPVQRAAALRRRTWCAPQRSGLPPILEHQPQPDFLWEKNKFKLGNNTQRLSNVTERDDDSTAGSRDSFTSGREADTPGGWKNAAAGEVICLDESDEVTNSRCTTPPLCSPDHKCFGIHHTPPCVLRSRAHTAEKELKEIEELTTLENMYAPNEVELIQLIALLRTKQEEILSQKQATDEEYEKIQKDVAQLKESLEKTSKDRDEAKVLRKKSEEEAKSLRCINTDLEFQIENLQTRTQNREKELINSLKEAREEKERSQITRRLPSVPQFLNMSRDISSLVNSDTENIPEISVENDTVKSKDFSSQKEIDTAEKDKCISELRELLKCKTLEKEFVESELNAKLILINSMEVRDVQKSGLLSEQTKQFAELTTKFENVVKELDKSNCKLLELTEENNSISTYVSQMAELKEQMEKLTEENNSISTYVNQITDLKQQVEKFTEENNSISIYVNQIAELKEQVEKLTEENNSVSTYVNQIAELKEQVEKLTEENNSISTYVNQIAELKGQMKMLTEENNCNSTYRNQIDELKEQVEKLNEENSAISIYVNQIAELKEQMKKLTEENNSISTYVNQIAELQEQTEKLTGENNSISTYGNQIAELKEQMEKLTEENNSISTYVNQIAELKEQIEKLTEENNSISIYVDQIAKLKEKLEKLTEENNSISTYVNQIAELKEQMEKLAEENHSISIYVDQITKLKDQLEKLTEENNSISTYVNQIAELKEQMEKLTEENNSISTYVNQIVELKNHMEKLTEENNSISTYVNHIAELKKQMEKLSEENNSISTYVNQIAELKEQMEKLTEENNSISTYVNQIAELKEQMEKLAAQRNSSLNLDEQNNSDRLIQLECLITNMQNEISNYQEQLSERDRDISCKELELKSVFEKNKSMSDELLIVKESLLRMEAENIDLNNNINLKNSQIQMLTKDISESNLRYSTISQINEELKKNLEDITGHLNDKSALVENLQQTLIELENELQKSQESQRHMIEMIETLTKDISERNLQYATISQINEELKKEIEDNADHVNDKDILVKNLQQTITQLECRLRQNEETVNYLNEKNGQIESDKLYLETFLNEKCTEITELIEQTNSLHSNVKTIQSTIESKSLTESNEEISLLKNENNSYIILIEELKQAVSKYDCAIQEKECLIAELNSRILCLQSDVNRVTESWENSSLKVDNLQNQLEQAVSHNHNLQGIIERLTAFLQKDESLLKNAEQEIDMNKNNIYLEIAQSENKDVIDFCRVLFLFKINFDNLKHLQINVQSYESEINKLKNIIETQKQDLIKSKIIKKEFEDLQYLIKDPFNDKENLKKSAATLTPLKKKKEDIIPSSQSHQLYLSPRSPMKLEALRESCNLGKSKTSPVKNKLDVKKVLELILNEINSNKESCKPANNAALNIPELKFVLEKLRELKMALTASLESGNLLQERVLKLENINNELRTILKNTHLKMSAIDKIHSDIYSDGDMTFSGGRIDEFFEVFKHSINDILSVKSTIQQGLTCMESETESDVQTAIIVETKHEGVDEISTYSSVEECRQITYDLDKLDMFISLFETNMFEAYSLLEVRENGFSHSEETYKCGYDLETKLYKVGDMHRFLIEKLKNLITTKNDDYEKLLKQNILLKNDMELCEKEVRELVREAEELGKRVLYQRSESEVSYAEYSLLNSQYTTVQHHHSNLHSSCISTASYLREQLTHLQLTLLQSEKVNNENDLSFDFSTPKKCPSSDTVSNVVIENESINTPVNLIPETPSTHVDNSLHENLKLECEKLHNDLNVKCSEIKRLSDQLADHESLKLRYSQLQKEHEILSSELMDCLQETDEAKESYNSLKTELEAVKSSYSARTAANTSLQTDKIYTLDTSIQTSTCAANLESRETNTSLAVESVHDTIENECKEYIKKYIYSLNEVVPDAQCTLLEWLKLYVTTMEKRLSSLSQELTAMEDCNRHLQSDVVAKQKLLDDYQNKMLSVQDELLCKSSETSTLQSEILKHKEDLTNASNVVQNLQDTNRLLKSEIEQQNDSTQLIMKAHETKEKNLKNEFSEKENDLMNVIESLKNDLNDRVSEISRLQSEVKNKDNILNSLNEKYDNLCKSMSDVNLDSDKHKIELSALQLKISDTLEEKFKLKEEIDNSLQTIGQLKEELSSQSNQLAELQKDNHVLADKEKILSQSLDDANNNFALLKSKFQDQEKELKEMFNLNSVISELQLQIATDKEEKRKLSNDIKMLENEIQTLKLHIKKSDKELETSADQIKDLLQNNVILKRSEEELSKTMEEAIKNLRNESEARTKELKDNIIESEATIKQLKDNIIILNDQLKCKQNALNDHEIKFSELNKAFKERENLLEIVSNKYEDDKKKHALQVATLGEELHKLNTEKILIEEERFSLLSNNDQLSRLLNEKDLEIEARADKIRKSEVTSTVLTSLQFENRRLQTDLQNQMDNVKGLQLKIKTLVEARREESYSAQRLQQLEADRSQLLSTNHILENRVADLQAELSALLKSSPKMRHDLHLRRQSLHDLQRSLVQHGDNLKTSTEDNDISMEDCGVSRENSELKEKVNHLDLQLKRVEDKYRQLEHAHSNKAEEFQKMLSAYNTMEAKLKEMRKPKQDATTNTNPEDKGALMSLFVDKMTHDFLNEKYKNLQKANEDYRMKIKEQAVELRRLQHTLQNNTLHNLLPRDESKNIELQAQVRTLEHEIKVLRERERDQVEWEAKYKEMDVEYDACVDQLKETTSSYNSLCSEKLLLEVELQNLKSELDNKKKGSPGREIRRKRQSIYDANRGTSLTTADACTNTIPGCPSQPPFMCTYCEFSGRSLEEMKIRYAELETRLSLQSAAAPAAAGAGLTSGSGVIKVQKLHELMEENQMLKTKLHKYKEHFRKLQPRLTQDNQNKK